MIDKQQLWLKKARQQRLTQHTSGNVAASYAAILLQFLQQHGYSSDILMAQANINASMLKPKNANIRADQYASLVQAALRMTGNPALGLFYGQRLNISTHGLLGFAVMSSPSLEKAAELTMKYIQIRNQLVNIQFDSSDKAQLGISFHVNLQADDLYRFEVETSISSLFSICKELLGSDKAVNKIQFSFAKPEDSSVYKTIFGKLPIEFSCDCNTLFIKSEALNTTGRVNNHALMQVAEKQCQNLLRHTQSNGSNLSRQVEQLLLNDPAHFISQEAIANHLGMSSRTLTRRLAKEKNSFMSIRNHLHQSLATQSLLETNWSVDEIAGMLNYSDSANFNRAFKRWFQLTPSQYRKRHGLVH